MKCPVKRIEKSNATVKVTSDKDMINIDASIKIKNPINWIIEQLDQNNKNRKE